MDPLKLFALTLMMYSSGLHGEDNFLDTPGSIQLLRNMKELIANIIGKTSEPDNPVYKEAQKLGHIQPQMSNDTPFPCDVSDGRSQRVPTSIHKLKAGDIDIIGAMGDSLTAGFGIFATNIFNIVVENRGASAYGGGQRNWRELLTLPNILKEYNSNLYGYATDDSFSHQSSSHFNVGESLAMSRDLPYMANNLIQRMKSDPRVDIENHWKMITIFMGANDICSDICWVYPSSKALDNHKNNLIKTFRVLRDNLPRTLVSVVVLPNIMIVADLKGKSVLCDELSRVSCSCLVGLPNKNRRAEFQEIIDRWQQLDQEIAFYPEFQTEDFSVVPQTFAVGSDLPVTPNGYTDLRYLSADCFHFSQRLQARAAVGLWTNLFQNAKEKSPISWDESFPCPPKENPYISTPGNS